VSKGERFERILNLSFFLLKKKQRRKQI